MTKPITFECELCGKTRPFTKYNKIYCDYACGKKAMKFRHGYKEPHRLSEEDQKLYHEYRKRM